jgi:alkyl hydroperoxide reductase subunit AhpC
MSIRLGDDAPNFKANTTIGEIDFYEYLGNSWGVLFSHPADFTPVCTTELGRTALLKEEFSKRNVKVLAVSVDPIEKHLSWVNDINETQHCTVDFPIIADDSREVSALYDMIHPNQSETATVRSLFVIDPKKKVRLTITYPMSTGRNFDEVLRVIDALQLTDAYTVATPGNWKDGDDVIIPLSVQDEAVIKQKYPKGYRSPKPYLRITPQPNK